jgi:hypothetical protein
MIKRRPCMLAAVVSLVSTPLGILRDRSCRETCGELAISARRSPIPPAPPAFDGSRFACATGLPACRRPTCAGRESI